MADSQNRLYEARQLIEAPAGRLTYALLGWVVGRVSWFYRRAVARAGTETCDGWSFDRSVSERRASGADAGSCAHTRAGADPRTRARAGNRGAAATAARRA